MADSADQRWLRQLLPSHMSSYNTALPLLHQECGLILLPSNWMGFWLWLRDCVNWWSTAEGMLWFWVLWSQAVHLVHWNTYARNPELPHKGLTFLKPPSYEEGKPRGEATVDAPAWSLSPSSPSTGHVSGWVFQPVQPPAVKLPPTFVSSYMRPQTSWRRDKPSLLCLVQILDPQTPWA